MMNMNKCSILLRLGTSLPIMVGGTVLFLLTQMLSSCISPDPVTELSPEEKDLYVTNRDKSVNFANYRTYFIGDSVNTVSKEFGTTEEGVSLAPVVLSTLEQEMQKA